MSLPSRWLRGSSCRAQIVEAARPRKRRVIPSRVVGRTRGQFSSRVVYTMETPGAQEAAGRLYARL